MLSRPLLERLTTSKYLLAAAHEEAAASGPFAAGRAILLLQDATEMLLRIAAEHLHASLKEQAAFAQVVEAVEAASGAALTHRSSLNQLNKARVNFKHFGLLPTDDDVAKLLVDMDAFFPDASRALLGVDLAAVSLRHLVGHCRTENWLAIADANVESAEFDDAITAAAIAFAVLLRHYRTEPQQSALSRLRCSSSPEIKALAEAVGEEFKRQAANVDLIIRGIDLRAYNRFLRLTPDVQLSMAGTVHIDRLAAQDPIVAGKTEAFFCTRFVIDAALALRRNHMPSRIPLVPASTRRVRVTRDAPLLVWPADDPEVVRTAVINEDFPAFPPSFDTKAHVAVNDAGDKYYIAEDAVVVVVP